MEDKKNKITINIFYETLKRPNKSMSISDCKEKRNNFIERGIEFY